MDIKWTNLRELRQAKNLTQKDIANALGIKDSAVSKWETGDSIPRLTISQTKALCSLLGVSVDDLPNDFSGSE